MDDYRFCITLCILEGLSPKMAPKMRKMAPKIAKLAQDGQPQGNPKMNHDGLKRPPRRHRITPIRRQLTTRSRRAENKDRNANL